MRKDPRPDPENLLAFPRKTPVSVIVPAKNEEANLGPCLRNLEWADEIFVVDSQSTDDTARIAEKMGAKVVQFYFSGSYPKKKNWALENLPFRNEWVLIVDADEWIPSDLSREIAWILEKEKGFDGYYMNRRFFFMGRWIRHCGYYPSYNLRLFKHRLGRYEKMIAEGAGDNEVHEHILLQGTAGYLHSDMEHYAYPDIATFVEKHNRYSNWEANLQGRFRSGAPDGSDRLLGHRLYGKRILKRLYLRLPFRFPFRFLYAYFWKRGFLDGWAGLIFCILLSFYDFLTWAKTFERKNAQPSSNRLLDSQSPQQEIPFRRTG
jgi:glycosyltransferase involved in cell wall biosynthesis